ncbi:membrane bound O-acyl transferase family-domain-containing protein [Mycena filopes]|nr:membrane bound O-acyl transferase family-domain-containing protein [Mycena filopes]
MSRWTYPFSTGYIVLFFGIILTSLAVKPSPLRRFFFVPILILTYFVLIHTTSGDHSVDYGLRLVWLLYFLFASDYILLTDVQRELHRIPKPSASAPPVLEPAHDSEPPPTPAQIEHSSLWQRTKWSLDLLTSPRGVNWAHEPRTALPPHPAPSTSRTAFILRRILTVALIYIIYDSASLYINSTAAFEPGPDAGLAGLPLGQRGAAVLAWVALGYAGMALQHYILGIVCVAVRLTGPDEWPAFFGGVADAWSVRTFWGRGWHQMLRRPLTTHAARLTSALGLAPGARITRLTTLLAVFLLSGLMHAVAAASTSVAPRSSSWSWNAGAPALLFFLLQPLAIVLEDAVRPRSPAIAMVDSNAVSHQSYAWVRTLLGYVWTASWFVATLPLWQDGLIRRGMMDRGLPREASLVWVVWGRLGMGV